MRAYKKRGASPINIQGSFGGDSFRPHLQRPPRAASQLKSAVAGTVLSGGVEKVLSLLPERAFNSHLLKNVCKKIHRKGYPSGPQPPVAQ